MCWFLRTRNQLSLHWGDSRARYYHISSLNERVNDHVYALSQLQFIWTSIWPIFLQPCLALSWGSQVVSCYERTLMPNKIVLKGFPNSSGCNFQQTLLSQLGFDDSQSLSLLSTPSLEKFLVMIYVQFLLRQFSCRLHLFQMWLRSDGRSRPPQSCLFRSFQSIQPSFMLMIPS